MGRPRLNKRTVEVRLTPSVHDQVRERLSHPFSQQVQHGSFSKLVESLLRQWLRDEVSGPEPTFTDPLNAGELLDDKDAPTESS